MKQLFLIALMATVSFASKAQNDFTNNTNCDLRIRTVCIDETNFPFGCTPVSYGSWIAIPALMTTSIPPVGGICSGANVFQGYEIDYAVSTGCSGNPTMFTTNTATSCYHGSPAWPGAMGLSNTCSCANGGHVNIQPHYDSGTGDMHFDANN